MGYPYFSNPYQQPYYQPPVPDQLAQLRQNQFQPPQIQPPQQMPTQQSAPNPIMLMDSDANTFYLKSADGSGVPQPLRIFDCTERTVAPKTPVPVQSTPESEYVTRTEFNASQEKIDALQDKIDAFLSASANNSKRNKEESNDGESTV